MEIKRVSFMLPKELHDLLRRVSYEKNINNQSAIVRTALTQYFEGLGYDVPEFDIKRGGDQKSGNTEEEN